MRLFQFAWQFTQKLVAKGRSLMRRKVVATDAGDTKADNTTESDLPVYLKYTEKTDRGSFITYCIVARTNQFGSYSTYRSVSKDFPIPYPHDKAACELFLGYPLLELCTEKEKSENKFGMLTVDEKKFIQGKLDEGFAYMKEKGRDFHFIVLKTELQADWCMSRTPKAKRTTDLCVEIHCENPSQDDSASCSGKETYKIEDKSSSTGSFTEKTHNNTSNFGYGYANSYRAQNTRHDGKRWDYDKKEWIEDVPKPNHPIPVLLEGEELVEIPEA